MKILHHQKHGVFACACVGLHMATGKSSDYCLNHSICVKEKHCVFCQEGITYLKKIIT